MLNSMTREEYNHFVKTGSTQPKVATKANTRRQVLYEADSGLPKGMKGYSHNFVRVVRNGEIVGRKWQSKEVLDLINDKTKVRTD